MGLKQNTVLIVEDSPEFQLMIHRSLESKYSVTCASSAEEALAKLKETPFDLMLLDVGLPQMSGYELVSLLKKENIASDMIIIFVTGKVGLEDKIEGFSVGADDYIVKPFEPLELRARVESKLRKKNEVQDKGSFVKAGDIELSVPYQRAVIHKTDSSTSLVLSPLEFKLLYYFVNREDRILTRTQLLKEVWGDDVVVLERTIDKHISALRQKLDSETHTIKTVTGKGYKFQKTPEV